MAACLYRHFVDQHEYLYGPLDSASADAVYRDGKRLGTTLQVPESMWPTDHIAFDEYWRKSLAELRIDPPVRRHLHGVASLVFLPWPLRVIGGPLNLFATTGFLPERFRELMDLPWTAGQQRRFEWLLTGLRVADRVIPQQLWIAGYQMYLRDMRSRARRAKRHRMTLTNRQQIGHARLTLTSALGSVMVAGTTARQGVWVASPR